MESSLVYMVISMFSAFMLSVFYEQGRTLGDEVDDLLSEALPTTRRKSTGERFFISIRVYTQCSPYRATGWNQSMGVSA